MSEKRSKVETFVGFALRKRALITGANSVRTLKKAKLLLLCATAAENTRSDALGLALKWRCPLVECKISLEDITGKANCKIAAMTDKDLANAVLNNLDENFSVISGGIVR